MDICALRNSIRIYFAKTDFSFYRRYWIGGQTPLPWVNDFLQNKETARMERQFVFICRLRQKRSSFIIAIHNLLKMAALSFIITPIFDTLFIKQSRRGLAFQYYAIKKRTASSITNCGFCLTVYHQNQATIVRI